MRAPRINTSLSFANPKKAFYLVSSVIYLTTAFLGVFAVNLPRAHAAGDPEYALYFPNTDEEKAQLRAAAADGGIGSSDASGALSKTYIVSKGGPLGTFILKLNANGSDDQDLPSYTGDYYCYPTEGYHSTFDGPDDKKPYIRYTYGVTILKDNDWKGIADDANYYTQVGLYGYDKVGSVHFPQVDPKGGSEVKAQDFDLNAEDGIKDVDNKYNLNENASFDKKALFDAYSFNNPVYGAPAGNKADLDKQALNNCRMKPRGKVANKVINLQNDSVSTATKKEWDKAMKDDHRGDTVADAIGKVEAAKTATGADAPGLSCGGFDINPFDLSWITCPVMSAMKEAVSTMDDFINTQMSIGSNGANSDPNQIFCDSGSHGGAKKSCYAYYQAWSSVRNIALGLMAIAALIVLIAQALGFELLDAYTIRKVLPRLLIAAVGLTLSWQLMQFFVTLSNNLAFGIRFLIYQPFTGFPDLSLRGSSQFLAGAGGLTALAFLGWLGLASFLLTALLAVLIAVLVLILRQLLIIMLIIFAPIAIIAYILPNTKKIYDLWWDSFSKALLMFALISGLIAIGRVFSAVAAVNSDSQFSQLVGVASYFMPYFLIPATFKFAGGAIRNIGGFVNDRGKGGFDRLRNLRANQTKKNAAKLMDGTRLKSGEQYEGRIMGKYAKFARGFDRSTKGASDFVQYAGINPRQWGARRRAGAATDAHVGSLEAREKNKDIRALEGDDDLIRAGFQASQRGLGDGFVRKYLEDANYENVEQGVALVRRARNSANTEVFEGAMVPMMFGSKSGLDPTYKLKPDGSRAKDANGNDIVLSGGLSGAGEGRQMAVDAARGDGQRLIRILGDSRDAAERAGRIDLSQVSYTEDLASTQALARGDVNIPEVTNRTLDATLDGAVPGRTMQAHKRSVQAVAKRLQVRLGRDATVPRNANGQLVERPKQAEDAFSRYATLGSMMDAGGPPEAVAILKEEVMDQVVDVATLPERVRNELGPAAFETITEPVQGPGGSVILDPKTGRPEVSQRQIPRKTMSHAEVKEGLQAYSPTYGRYKREYGRATDAAAAAAARGAAEPPPAA